MAFWRASKTVEDTPCIVPMLGVDHPIDRWLSDVDRVDRSRIIGWCCDLAHPEQSVAVEALASNGAREVVIACLFREDVRDAGHGAGHHGFEIELDRLRGADSVSLRFAESREPITREPIPLDPVRALLTQAFPQDVLRSARHMAAEITASDPGQGGDGSQVDARLLESADAARDPEGLVTRFLAQEGARFNREGCELDPAGTFQERLGLLLWYIGDYAQARVGPSRVPLSERQVAALNAPAPIGGAEPAITVALHNFVLRELPSHARLADPVLAREATYWWCVERAPGTRLEDRLVTQAQVELLRRETHDYGSDFSCNDFMVLYRERRPELHALDLAAARDRAALLAYLVLASALRPDLLRFLPAEPLRRMLRPTASGTVPLDAILGRLVADAGERLACAGSPADRTAVGTQLRARCEARLGAVGLSLRAGRTPSRAWVDAGASRASPVRPGVGVIGPLRLSSGLGHAARLSLETLAAVEAEVPAALAFDLESPAPVAEELRAFARLDGPRPINLLHLNAEAVPLAFAYGPRTLLAGRYNIGFFFWELSEIPPCQMLALELLDEIWVASEFNRALYARHTSKPVIRVGMAAPALPDGAAAPRRDVGLGDDSFVFLVAFDALSFVARKNPLAVIEAFRRAFPRGDEPVELLLKTRNRSQIRDPSQVRLWRRIERAVAADARIVLTDEELTRTDLLALARTCDCYVSLHRAEGWGFGLVEAMQLGLPVICTGYSGNADFCTADTAFLVDHVLVPVPAEEYINVAQGSLWAEPSIAAAAAHMRHVVSDRAAAARKAESARQFVARELCQGVVAERYARRLAAIRDGGHCGEGDR